MSYDFVGLENLPNVYVKKISLSDNNQNTFKVDVSILMLDEVFDNSFVWSDDNLIFDYLKVALVATSNSQLISSISNGTYNPHPSMLRKNLALMPGTTIIETSAKQSKIVKDADTRRYSKKISLVIPTVTSTMTLFAFTYVDTVELSKALRISLTGPLAHYCGSISSENVIVDGEVEKSTFIYEESDGSVWSGPVHQNAARQWMGGSFHSNAPHPVLTRKIVLNTKIIDKREDSFVARAAQMIPKKPTFSELSTSLSDQADLVGLFSIDFRNLIITKTKYGSRMFATSKSFFEDFASSVAISSLEIRRQQVKFTASTNRLGTRKFRDSLVGSYRMIDASIEQDGVLVSKDRLSQIFVIPDTLIKTYQFVDDEMSERSRGEFRYEVVVSFVDNSRDYLLNIIAQMNTYVSQLKDQREKLFRPSKYDRENDSLREGEVVPDVFNQAIENYYQNLSIFVEMDDEKKSELVTSKKNSFLRDNYTNKEAENFIAQYSAIVTKMRKRFDLESATAESSVRARPNTLVTPGLTSISYVFKNRVKFDVAKSSYDYLGVPSSEGVVRLSKSDYFKRAEKEVSRFFDTSRSTTSTDLADMDTEDMIAIKDLSEAKVGFLSPLSFKFKSQIKDLTSLQNLDMDGVSINFTSHITEKQSDPNFSSAAVRKSSRPETKKPKTKNRRAIKKRRLGRIKFAFRRTPIKINNLKTEEHLEVSSFLGKNSEMVNVEGNLTSPPEAPQASQVERKLSITNGLSVKREKISFDLLTKNNNFEIFKSSPKFNPERLRKMPVAIKALFNSRSTAAKNNILESESDIMRDAETKVATEMIFHASQKIEYFSEFELDANGYPDVSQPKWEDVTPTSIENNQRMVCRMRYAQIPELGIKPSEEFKLLPQNETFIISDEPLSILPTITEDVESLLELEVQLPEVDDIVFASSNYVKQNSSRKAQVTEQGQSQQSGGAIDAQDSIY
jgi:hypothetical protein